MCNNDERRTEALLMGRNKKEMGGEVEERDLWGGVFDEIGYKPKMHQSVNAKEVYVCLCVCS